MKTTLNPFENAKRTAQGTGGGVSPAVIEKMQAEISVLGSENATMAQDIIDIKGSLKSINDNLSKTTISSDTRVTLQFETNYTTSADGYFFIICPGNANGDINYVIGRLNGIAVACVSNTGNPRATTSSSQANISGSTSIFVRKGSVISYTSSGSNIGSCYFYPLS